MLMLCRYICKSDFYMQHFISVNIGQHSHFQMTPPYSWEIAILPFVGSFMVSGIVLSS